MIARSSICGLLLLLAIDGLANGQEGAPPRPTGLGDWRVPLHSAPADPAGGDYGIWAAGADFKASFHDGFAFYPYLGAAHAENLPIVWRTESIRAGGELLARGEELCERWWSGWRCELRYPGVVEAYDVLASGVEQSFIFAAAPASEGDLVVTGRVESALHAAPRDSEHGALVFADPLERPLVVYSAAFALDAHGRRVEVETAFDGERIRLRIPATWLADACYPVVLDPLTTRVPLSYWGGTSYGMVSLPDLGRDDESNELLVTHARQFSGNDYDAYGQLCGDDFSQPFLVFADATANWSTSRAAVAFASGADRWVLALERLFGGGAAARIRAYVHARADLRLNSGATVYLDPPTDHHDWRPDAGGTAGGSTGTKALIVFQRDPGQQFADTDTSQALGVLLDAGGAQPAFGSPFSLEAQPGGARFDRDLPSLNQVSDGGSASWIATWQQYDNQLLQDDWDVQVARVRVDGAVAGQGVLGPGRPSVHKLLPRIEGRGGRYLASYTLCNNAGKAYDGWGHEIQVQRLDWPESSAAPRPGTPKALAIAPGNDLVNGRSMGFDSNTRSHWALGFHTSGWDVHVVRTGYSGGIVEARIAYDAPGNAYSPALSFNADDGEFPLVLATDEGAPAYQPVYGARLEYPPAANTALYGAGCRGRIEADPPHAGSEFFAVRLMGGVPRAATALLIGMGPGSHALGGGCYLNLDPFRPLLVALAGTTDIIGTLRYEGPLPDDPVLTGTIHTQWIQLAPALVSTQGLRIQIR